jgi:hypothetical protein
VNKTHKIVKMQKLLEGDKDYNIGKLQEILERAEKRHTLEDLGIYSFIYIYMYHHNISNFIPMFSGSNPALVLKPPAEVRTSGPAPGRVHCSGGSVDIPESREMRRGHCDLGLTLWWQPKQR